MSECPPFTLETKEENHRSSPSQKIQSHEQRKQVVARGLLHLLHDKFDAAGLVRPLELPGGIPADERMDIPVPTRGTIPDVDMLDGNIFSMDDNHGEKAELINNGRHCDVLLRSSEVGRSFSAGYIRCTYV